MYFSHIDHCGPFLSLQWDINSRTAYVLVKSNLSFLIPILSFVYYVISNLTFVIYEEGKRNYTFPLDLEN